MYEYQDQDNSTKTLWPRARFRTPTMGYMEFTNVGKGFPVLNNYEFKFSYRCMGFLKMVKMVKLERFCPASRAPMGQE